MSKKNEVSPNQKRFMEVFNPQPYTSLSNMRQRQATRELRRVSSFIAIEILHAMDCRGWTTADLAKAMGVSSEKVANWVGGSENFTLDTLLKLEAALNIRLIAIDK